MVDCTFEEAARAQGFKIVAGVDEAGRGPLAGPVVAAACIIPAGRMIEGVDDSKKLSAAQRDRLFELLTSDSDIVFGVGVIETAIIDRVNILQATILAMIAAVDGLASRPDFLLVDGLKLPHATIPCQKIIKGDQKSQSIAAASIIAKVTRDRLMREYHERWPEYGFDAHKGYGTAYHCEAIAKLGPSPIHRMTFEPLKSLYV